MPRAFLAILFILALAVPAVAHPHEWYDVSCECDLADGRGEMRLSLRLTPDPFTNGSLYQLGDRDRSGSLDATELAQLADTYRDSWESVNWFCHPMQNGEACRPVRAELIEFRELAPGSVEIRITTAMPLVRQQTYSTINLLFFDMSNYTALRFSKHSLTVLAHPDALSITGVSQSRQSEVRVQYKLKPLPEPPAPPEAAGSTGNGPADPADPAGPADPADPAGTAPTTAATDPAARPAASMRIALPPPGNGAAGEGASQPDATPTWWERIEATQLWVRSELHRVFLAVKAGDLSLTLLLLALAFGYGLLHALGPGHGKALVGAWLIQKDGRFRDVAKLSFIIAYVHTLSAVVVIGAVKLVGTLLAGGFTTAGEKSFTDGSMGWLGLVSGCLVVLLGLWLLVQRLRGHDDHDDDHHDASDLRKLAFAVGIVPCPAAMMVMLLALGFDAFGTGVLMVIALAAGIGTVLMGVGIMVLASRHKLTGFLRRRAIAALAMARDAAAEAGGRAVASRVAASQPQLALAGAAVASLSSPGFTREDEIQWLDDDGSEVDAATLLGNGDGFTREDAIEWLDGDEVVTGDEAAAAGPRDSFPELSDADRALAADQAAADASVQKWLHRIEDVFGYGGGLMVIVLGGLIAYYHAHWVLQIL